MKMTEVVAAVIVGEGDNEGQYLISQRLKESKLGHCWEFPGGKIEPGETQAQCAVRECQEEIGVEIEVLELIRDIPFEYPFGKLMLHFWKCRLLSGIPRPIYCRDVRWVRPEELKDYQFPEADREIIREISQSKERV